MTACPLFRFLFLCLGILGAEPLANANPWSGLQESQAIERESPLFSNESFNTRGGTTEVGEDEDVAHPVFLGNRAVVVNGSVGDLFAAGGTVMIKGRVTDNAFIAARRLTVAGAVDGDLFVFAETVVIEGVLGGDLYGAFEEVRVKRGAVVAGDLHVGGARVIIEGRVDGRLVGAADEIRIDGQVGGDVLVAAGSIELSGESKIGGDLHYDTRGEPVIHEGARVRGETRRVRYEKERHRRREWDAPEIPPVVRALLKLGAFLLSLIVAGLCLAVGGETALRPSRLLSQNPAMGLGVGFLVSVLVPIIAVLLILLCLTAPIGIVMLIALPVALYLGALITAESLGRWVLGRGGRQPNAFLCLLLGLFVYHLLGYVELLGGMVRTGWSIAGLGALFLVLRGARAKS